MGKKKQRRTSGKRRRRHGGRGRASAGRRATSGAGGPSGVPPSVEELAGAAAWSWNTDPARHTELVDALVQHGPAALAVVDRLQHAALEQLWPRGWAPVDVVHIVGRKLSAAHADAAAQVVTADGAARARRGEALHPRWRDQLAALTGRAAPTDTKERVRLGVAVLNLFGRLPDVAPTVPRPGAAAMAATPAAVRLDGRVLARVRGLLAKAESTEFEQEAEALTAKAQELIAGHAIDEALLHSADDVGAPSVRRLPVDDPYADAKAFVLAQVADANRCRVVHSAAFGWVTAFGYDADLDALELLSTSLLVQATGAMTRHGPRRDAVGRSTTRSFRRSFLYGFGYRVGQRLRDATEAQVVAADAQGRLLPVLSSRDDRVRQAEEAAFPRVTRRTGSVSNGAGWAAGQVAGEFADLAVTAGVLRDPA